MRALSCPPRPDLQPGVPGSVIVADAAGDGAVDGPGLLPAQVLLGQGREVRRDLLVDPRCGSKGPVHVRRYLRCVPEAASGLVLGSLQEHLLIEASDKASHDRGEELARRVEALAELVRALCGGCPTEAALNRSLDLTAEAARVHLFT